MKDKFTCDCGGPIRETDDPTRTYHACKNKYAVGTSYYTGIDTFVLHERVQINPELTGGQVDYNWFVKWFTTAEDAQAAAYKG